MNFIQENSKSEAEFDECSEYTQKYGKSAEFRLKNRLHWTVEENTKYCHFLFQNKFIFESDCLRKKSRIFSQLAVFMSTRNKSCVKSHHQKMIKRHTNVEGIIRFMEKKYRITVIPSQNDWNSIAKKEAELQTDKQSISEAQPEKQSSKQKESLQIFIKDNAEPEQIGYDGFEISEWEW